jgi:hypothetical protein
LQLLGFSQRDTLAVGFGFAAAANPVWNFSNAK